MWHFKGKVDEKSHDHLQLFKTLFLMIFEKKNLVWLNTIKILKVLSYLFVLHFRAYKSYNAVM